MGFLDSLSSFVDSAGDAFDIYKDFQGDSYGTPTPPAVNQGQPATWPGLFDQVRDFFPDGQPNIAPPPEVAASSGGLFGGLDTSVVLIVGAIVLVLVLKR